jgi:hypothetical protein
MHLIIHNPRELLLQPQDGEEIVEGGGHLGAGDQEDGGEGIMGIEAVMINPCGKVKLLAPLKEIHPEDLQRGHDHRRQTWFKEGRKLEGEGLLKSCVPGSNQRLQSSLFFFFFFFFLLK